MTQPAESSPADVIEFWRNAGPERWYAKDEDFDISIRDRFQALHSAASEGLLDAWADSADGALALLILLDQFSRNMFRGSPQAFAQDERARDVAQKAIAAGLDQAVEPEFRQFFYTPFMHSEAIADQRRCVALSHSLPDAETRPYALDHEQIIRRFGRFPHRNEVLGRHTTPAERKFLSEGGFAG